MSSDPVDSLIPLSPVPGGAWAAGVSGGADSVAMLELLRRRTDLKLHVVHLDHQTRGQASTGDAAFVAQLARTWNLPCTMARRDEIEPLLVGADVPQNPSARYRALRLALFRREIEARGLSGVILAHHAEDQAETVLQRLLRGSGYAGLCGMSPHAGVQGVTILRPLLEARRAALRAMLVQRGIAWREDESNASGKYLRNRLRSLMGTHPQLMDALLGLAKASEALRDWARSAAPELGEEFSATELAQVPEILATEAVRRWLTERGMPAGRVDPAVIARVLDMARDAASPAHQDLPAGLRARRKSGVIRAERRQAT